MCCARRSARSSPCKAQPQAPPVFRLSGYPPTVAPPRLSAICPRTLFAQPQRFRLSAHGSTRLCRYHPKAFGILSPHSVCSAPKGSGFTSTIAPRFAQSQGFCFPPTPTPSPRVAQPKDIRLHDRDRPPTLHGPTVFGFPPTAVLCFALLSRLPAPRAAAMPPPHKPHGLRQPHVLSSTRGRSLPAVRPVEALSVRSRASVHSGM